MQLMDGPPFKLCQRTFAKSSHTLAIGPWNGSPLRFFFSRSKRAITAFPPLNSALLRNGRTCSTITSPPCRTTPARTAIGQGTSFPRRSVAPALLEAARKRSGCRVTPPPSKPLPCRASLIQLVVAEPTPIHAPSTRTANETSPSRATRRGKHPSAVPIAGPGILLPSSAVSSYLPARVPSGGSHRFMGAGLWGCDGRPPGEMRTPGEAVCHPSALPLVPREERIQFLKDWSRAG